MNLLIEYHKSKNLQRHAEFLACLHENLGNSLIEKIYVFISDDSILNFIHEKIVLNLIDNVRPTFKTLFDFCNTHLKDQVCIISCADIIFDESIKYLEKIDNKTFVALNRWEIDTDKPNGNAACQDVWVFRAPINISDELLNQMNFTAGGCWGCDNKIAYLMDEAGYELRNPGLQIKVKHFHTSNYRSVAPTTRLLGPYFALVPNDDITKKPEYIRIKEFNELGEAVLA